MLNKNTAIGQDYALRRNIFGVCGDLDKRKSFSGSLRKQEFQRAFSVAVALLPWHHRVADVPQTMGRKCRSTRLPPEADASGELAVPQPTANARNPGCG